MRDMKLIYILFLISGLLGLSSFSNDLEVSPPQVQSQGVLPTPVVVERPTLIKSKVKEEKEKMDNLVDMTNSYRLKNGLETLKIDNYLCNKAEIRVQEIKTDWSHDNFYKMKKSGFKYFGENLAKDFNTDQQVMNAWINSPTHNSNLIGDYTHTCIMRDRGYVVQLFGKL